jgi:hypothetical protein
MPEPQAFLRRPTTVLRNYRAGRRSSGVTYAAFVDAIAEYRAASEANDLDRFMRTLAPDAELVSPLLTHGVIRGKKAIRVVGAGGR